MTLVEWILSGVGLYAACGGLFAAAFVTRGVGELDAAARSSSAIFRLLLVPASIALWPLLLVQWRRTRRARTSP